ncbi:hypothetical protein ACIBG5_31300 [Kribbella sp. NPDC050241]
MDEASAEVQGLTVCQLEVFSVQDSRRTLVATGQQTLIQVAARPQR